MKTRNKKVSGTSAAEEEVELRTPIKRTETFDLESVGVLTRSQKKRLSAGDVRTPVSQALKQFRQSSVRKKRNSSTAKKETDNEEQNCSTQNVDISVTQGTKCSNKSIHSKRRSSRIQQNITHEAENQQSENHRREDFIDSKSKQLPENSSEDGNLAKRNLFYNLKDSDDEERSESSKNKNLSDIEEFEEIKHETSQVMADVTGLQKRIYDEHKCNKNDTEKKIEKLSESLGNRQHKCNTNENSQKCGSEDGSPRKKLRTSEVKDVKPDTTKSAEDSTLIKNTFSDSDDGTVLASQITDTSDTTKSSETRELIPQCSVKSPKSLSVSSYDTITSSKCTKERKESESLQEKISPLKCQDKTESQREINKKSTPLKNKETDISFKSSSLTEDGSSEGSSLTDHTDTKGNRKHSDSGSFKEPKLKVSKSSPDSSSHRANKKTNLNDSRGHIYHKSCAKKDLNAFGRYELKSPMLSSYEKRKSISSKEDANETSESDSDAESRKAIRESAHKRIIQNISTSESESRKAVLPVKTLQNLTISSDSDSGPESLGFNVARQQAKDSLKHAVESIQREKKRRKEKRKQRLEKYKQQKEEKLIWLKEKRASQEDASCSSSEESAYEEDEAAIASLSKSTKVSTPTKEKENIDDLLPSKRRKTDSGSIKPEEKKHAKDSKNNLPEDEEQQPCIGKLKKLADEILENLPDTAPVLPRKNDEKLSSQRKKNKRERQKHNKALKGSEVIRGMQDVDYIPLSTYGSTEFGAIPLNKMMRAPKSMAQQAAEFRQQMLYGSHIKRVSGNANMVYQQKLKASGKDRLVR